MKVKEIKELKIPEYDEFRSFKKYGTSKKCFLEKLILSKSQINAYCLGERAYFEDSPQGLEEAKQWLMAQRKRALCFLGFIEVEE